MGGSVRCPDSCKHPQLSQQCSRASLWGLQAPGSALLIPSQHLELLDEQQQDLRGPSSSVLCLHESHQVSEVSEVIKLRKCCLVANN